MAAKTTIKVALLTGAAKDDFFTTDATGLSEDLLLAALNVLGNDPGSAHLYSLQQNLSGSGQMAQLSTAFSALGAIITINADGTIAYDASNIESSLAHLAEGQLATDTFVYTVRMGSGALSTARVTLQIAGENDPPTLDSITPINIFDTSADDTPAAVTGMLPGHDVDDGAVLTYSLADTTGVDTTVAGVQTKQMEYGTLTLLTDTGAYSFLADPDKIDALADGSTEQVVFAVKVTDEHGASASQDIIFNLVGANDTAEIKGMSTGCVTEDGTTTASGTLTVSDRDAGAVGFVTTTSLQGTYGDFTFDNTSGLWDYKLRNGDTNVQGLAFNQQVHDTLTVVSQDGTASQTITVTVNGVNDPAKIINSFQGKVFEDGTLTTGNTVGVVDIDDDPTMPKLQSVSTSALHGTYGDFTFNNATGVWSYTLRNSDPNVQALGTINGSDMLTVISQDGTATADIKVLILGLNDPANITGNLNGSVAEDGKLTADGTLGVDDIDDNPAFPLFQSVTTSALHGIYGDFTFNITSGVWGYTLRNPDANVQGLALNQLENDTLVVTSLDGTSTKTIKVAVTGANETATITGTNTGDVTEDGTLSASGTLSVTDPDDNPANPLFQSADAAALHGTYGDFIFNQNSGAWSFALRNGDDNVQALTAADRMEESLTVISQDGTATQTITVFVNGVNEASTGGGGGTTPPADPAIIFNVGLAQLFSPTGEFQPIDGFTANDMIRFLDGIIFYGSNLYNYDRDVGNTLESTIIQFYFPDPNSQNTQPFTAGIVALVGFNQFDAASMIAAN